VPTILLTSDSDVPTAVSALQAGAVDFIEKPFVDRQLLERVERAVTYANG
jgi:two-component system response regulator FixJ